MAFGSVLQHTQHNIGRAEPSVGVGDPCAGCNKPILDKFLLNVLERGWHAHCVRCCECLQPLTDKCFSREAKLYCRNDFFRRYGTKCTGCGQGIAPSDLVRKPRDKVFHLNCFTCCICRKKLSTGEQLYVLDDNKYICKDDYLMGKGPHPSSLTGRAEPSVGVGDPCAGCNKPILDKFLLNVLERGWHAHCVRCCECLQPLTDKCFSREAKLYCRNDFFRRYGTKCTGCGQGIAPSDLVRKPRDKVFHLNCFTCCICRKKLSTGEQLYVLDDNKYICKDDYLMGKGPHPSSLTENIQPLAAGRNVEQLEVALNAESQLECQEELLDQRRQFELAIANYAGDDPLELWFEYIGWVEQSYPKSGKESALDELLKKCLSKFEKESRYSQDPRLIRLFIKYIDSKNSPHLFYTRLYNSGVGTMVADLYIAWAHYFDVIDDFEKAKEVYQKGLDARAAPIDQLKQIYERFQFSVGQRVVRKEEYRQEFLSTMEAQRNAFTSLRSLKRSKVGSIRTGSAVKSHTPGRVAQSQLQSSSSNAQLKVYDGVSQSTSQPPTQPYRSVVEEIENSMVENNIEPGPWSKPSSRKSVFHNVHGNSALKFAILEDDIEQPPIKFGPLPPDDGNLAINLPKNFVRKTGPQKPCVVPAYEDDAISLHTMPAYHKFYLHPNEHMCFQPEELRQYKRLTDRNISNDFTKSRDKFWGIGSTVGVRVLPNFPRQNQPQTDMETERPDISLIPTNQQFECNLKALYPNGSKFELQFEENMRTDHQKNNANNAEDMDETVCVRGRQSFGVLHTRKSIVGGGRKSIMPVANDREFSIRKFSTATEDSGSDMDLDDDMGSDVNERATANALIDKIDEFLKPAAPKPRPPVLPNIHIEQPKVTQWSVFTDDDPKMQQSPEDMVQSPAIFSSKGVGSSVFATDRETFAVPQVPPVRITEKRTTEPMKPTDIPPANAVQSPYPIGPQTGAVRKSILRKSSISEHAIERPINDNMAGSSDNAAKLPLVDLDYSLCTQAFNVNLVEQMASTPVSTRRTEPLTEQFRAQDIQPVNPLKLSTIMETTEGSASAASTKSSTQFSSPEDDDLSKRSNVTNRTKLVGTTVCPDDGATGARENYSRSEPIPEFSVGLHASKVAGLANYSCSVEKTLPAIQLSLLPDATPIAPNKRGDTTAAVKDGPIKSYPFPIFEDSQTTTTSTPPVPRGSQVQHSSSSNNGQFNETSMWIKDEPKSFTLINNSAAEESFVLPTPCPPALGTTVTEKYNNFGEFAHQSNTAAQFDSSTAEDSFALPNIRQRKSMAPPTVYGPVDKLDGFETRQSNTAAQFDSSTAENSFALPNIRQRKSMAPPTAYGTADIVGLKTRQSQAEAQMDSSTSRESFALPNVQESNRTVGESCNHFERIESLKFKKEPQMDSSTTEESFALPNVQESNRTVGESSNHFERIESLKFKKEPQMDSSTTEESFALPNVGQQKSATIEVKDKSQTDVSDTEESFALPNDQQMSINNTTFDLDDSDSEVEIIEVPDETFIEDAPKIVNVQSLANRNNITDRFETSTRISISFTDEEIALHMNKGANAGIDDQSISFKNNSISLAPAWMENEAKSDANNRNAYQHEEVNLEESRMVIDTKLAEKFVDPFNDLLRGAILENLFFLDFLKEDASCELIAAVPTVVVKRTISFKDTHFDVLKCIGHGAYGRVYSVKNVKDGTTYAVKKEMPANLWEYYILREVHSRVVGNLSGYMKIDMAIMANDGSLLFSQYSQYGTLLDVCNRVFTSINNNINESIVFILAYQMLDLVDRLHKAGILHLDLKPDNFLVMRPMSSNHRELFIQLIDFGNSVDLRRYPAGQQFNAAIETKHFVCLEMLEQRPWIFQPDMYCLAAIHNLIEKSEEVIVVNKKFDH